MEVVADEALKVVHDLIADIPDTKGLGHLCSLACRCRTNGGLNETVLIFPSVSRLWVNCNTYLVRFTLLVVVDDEAKLALSILLAVLQPIVDFQFVALFWTTNEKSRMTSKV